MARSPILKKPGRTRATARGWRHSFWLWSGVGPIAATLVLVSLSAAAETERGTELIERVLALEPSERRGAELYSEHCASWHGRNAEGDGAQLALGKRYYQGLCAFCHGARGDGNEEHATPALRGQHYSYLLRQARLVSVGHRYSVDPTIAETFRVLPFDHLTAVADYASRLPADAPEPVNQPIANPRNVPARDEDKR